MQDCEILDVHGRPERLVLTQLIVPPVCIRPSVEMESAAGSNEDDITMKLMQIIEVNKIVEDALQKGLAINQVMVSGARSFSLVFFPENPSMACHSRLPCLRFRLLACLKLVPPSFFACAVHLCSGSRRGQPQSQINDPIVVRSVCGLFRDQVSSKDLSTGIGITSLSEFQNTSCRVGFPLSSIFNISPFERVCFFPPQGHNLSFREVVGSP